MFPKILKDIMNYLIEEGVESSTTHKEKLTNSALDEYMIIDKIKQRFDIEDVNIRNWYDFSVIENNTFYPINVKSTNQVVMII
jgi:hypothetical protein